MRMQYPVLIVLVYMLVLAGVSGATIEVANGKHCLDSYNASFSSIDSAISHASAGDSIIICPGEYSLSAQSGTNVDKPLLISGYKAGTVVIYKDGIFKQLNIISDNITLKNLTIVPTIGSTFPAIKISASNILLDTISIYSYVGKFISPGIRVVSSRNVTIVNLFSFDGRGEYNIEVLNSDNVRVVNSTFIKYLIKGINIFKLSNVTNSEFSHNLIYSIDPTLPNSYSGYGFYIEDSNNNSIFSNIFRRIDQCFYFNDSSSGNLFYDNYFDCAGVRDVLGTNYYNISRTPGQNIVGGSYLGGNYWRMGGGICGITTGSIIPYSGSDTDGDGIGDTDVPYRVGSDTDGDCSNAEEYLISTGDYAPLIKQRETSPPVVYSVNLNPDYELSSCTVLNASVASYDAPVSKCTLYIDGSSINMNISGSGSIYYCSAEICPSQLPEGYISYTVEVEDANNNTYFTEPRGIKIVHPRIDITVYSPFNGSYYNTTSIPLKVSSSSPIVEWIYSINGTNTTFTPNTTITASEGKNVLQIYARDASGFMGYAEVIFTVDTKSPLINLTSPLNATYSKKEIWVNATSSEPVNWSYSLNGVSFAQFIPNTTMNFSEGLTHLIIRAVDRAGNSAEQDVYFTVDTTPPAITMTSPANTTYASKTVLLNVSADETVDSWWYSLNGGANTTFMPNTTIVASEGVDHLVVYANDTAGNVGVADVYFTVDTTPPGIDIVYNPSPVEVGDKANFTFNISELHPSTVRVWRNGTPVYTDSYSSGVPINISVYSGGVGIWNYTIWANDTFGNENSTTIWVVVRDTVPPAIHLVSPANKTYANKTIVLNVSTSEIANVSYSLNGGANISLYNESTSGSATITASEDANHLIIYAVDTAGNWNSTRVDFTVDTKAPAITFVAPTPANGSTVGVNYVCINITASEPVGGALLEWNGTNRTMTCSGASCYVNVTGLGDGEYSYKVWVNDSIGNINTSEPRVVKVKVSQGAISSPPPAPGGGGGGGAPEDKNEIEKEIKEAKKGEFVKVEVKNEVIEEVEIKPKSNIYSAKLKVEHLDKLPSYIKKPPAEKIYKVIKITLSTQAVDKVKIKFKVSKKWLKENNINPKKVKMFHLHKVEWHEHKAKLIEKKGDEYIYEVEVERFSYFVIAGENGYTEAEAVKEPEAKQEEKIMHEMDLDFDFPLNISIRSGEKGKTEIKQKTPEEPQVVKEKVQNIEYEQAKGVCGPSAVLILSIGFALITRSFPGRSR